MHQSARQPRLTDPATNLTHKQARSLDGHIFSTDEIRPSPSSRTARINAAAVVLLKWAAGQRATRRDLRASNQQQSGYREGHSVIMGQAAPSCLLPGEEAAALLGPGLTRRIEEGFARGAAAAAAAQQQQRQREGDGSTGGSGGGGFGLGLGALVGGSGGTTAGALLAAATGGLWGGGGGGVGGRAVASASTAAAVAGGAGVAVDRRAFQRFLSEALPRMVRLWGDGMGRSGGGWNEGIV